MTIITKNYWYITEIAGIDFIKKKKPSLSSSATDPKAEYKKQEDSFFEILKRKQSEVL